MAIAGEFEKFSSNNNIRLVTDPDKEDATHFLFYTLEGWVLMDNKGVKNNIGKDFSFTRLNKLITPGKSSIYMELPPFKSMLDSLYLRGRDQKQPGCKKRCSHGGIQTGRPPEEQHPGICLGAARRFRGR